MSRFMLLVIALFFALVTPRAFAVQTVDLTPYLQAEVNEVATLNAQVNYLQQQADPISAGVVASYIPDHQMMVNLLSAQITAMGGNPTSVVPTGTPFLGTKQAIFNNDMTAHANVVNTYQDLAKNTDPTINRLAMIGWNGAARHFSSLQFALASTTNTPTSTHDGLFAALILERTAIADLQTQSARLSQLGDTANANKLMALIPRHQTQASMLMTQISQLGWDPATAVAPPVVAFDTSNQILTSERIINTQLVNSYAMAIYSQPANSPLQMAAMQTQPVALAALNSLFGVQVVARTA